MTVKFAAASATSSLLFLIYTVYKGFAESNNIKQKELALLQEKIYTDIYDQFIGANSLDNLYMEMYPNVIHNGRDVDEHSMITKMALIIRNTINKIDNFGSDASSKIIEKTFIKWVSTNKFKLFWPTIKDQFEEYLCKYIEHISKINVEK